MEQGRESTTNSTHIWHRAGIEPASHTGGRRALSSLRHPCSPTGLLISFLQFRQHFTVSMSVLFCLLVLNFCRHACRFEFLFTTISCFPEILTLLSRSKKFSPLPNKGTISVHPLILPRMPLSNLSLAFVTAAPAGLSQSDQRELCINHFMVSNDIFSCLMTDINRLSKCSISSVRCGPG